MEENKEISALFHLIDDPDEEVFNLVSTRIIDYGKGIIPNLENLWENTVSEEVQERIEMLIHRLHYRDLTEELTDPVELLFGVQLGGGTDINAALTYCQQVITKPLDTVLVLITDLYEGGNQDGMRKRAAELTSAGVQVIVLLALNDEGAPMYDHQNAQYFSNLGVPVFACTPDKFPDLMAAAISKQDIGLWAAKEDLAIKK